MSKLVGKLKTARQIVARSANGATGVLNACAKSQWLALATAARPNVEAPDLAKLAISLYLAHQQYVQNGIALREMRVADRDYRSDLRKSIKLLKDAQKTAGLFSNAISAIRAGMHSEIIKPPLFDEAAFRSKNGSNAAPDIQAKATAAALLEQFCPKKFLKNSDDARQLKLEGDELLRSIGFDIKQRGRRGALNEN